MRAVKRYPSKQYVVQLELSNPAPLHDQKKVDPGTRTCGPGSTSREDS